MLENLNPEQRLAVETTQGPLLVLSGAGTGKTRVLTTRVAYILNRGLAAPWQVLALTFTNKAANEMKSRLAAFSDGTAWYAGDVWCGTFHSMCLRILRSNADAAGLRRDFIIYGDDEQKTVLKNVLTDMGMDVKDFNPADWVERISAIKDKGLHSTEQPSAVALKILNAYNAELARMGAVDFGDIILRVLQLFDAFPDILARYQRQFRYILVDEFQDTNAAQMQFLQMLTRGVENPNILGAANSLIRHNTGRLGKDLHTRPDAPAGEPVYVLTVPSDFDEARLIADTIQHKNADEPFSNYAILIRAGSLSRMFEEEFNTRAIPYRLVGATKFYDRAEIRDAIAYLRLLVYPFDDISFVRIIGKPRRGFGPSAIAKLRASGKNLMDGLRVASLSGKQRAAADAFVSAFDFDWMSVPPMDAAQKLLDNVGYIQMWRESRDVDASDRLDNIRELVTNVIGKYDTLPEFLEHAALMMTDDNDSDDAAPASDAVSIMTIHAAKGLEFDTVFLPAWEEGIFPNDMAVQSGGLEEERRLAYVAITRARRRAIIINAMSRMVFGNRQYNSPSRFITEMDNKFLEFQGGTPHGTYNYRAPAHPTPKPRPAKQQKNIVGQLVEHAEMGRGVVIEENGDILTVAFRARGIKKVDRRYVKFLD